MKHFICWKIISPDKKHMSKTSIYEKINFYQSFLIIKYIHQVCLKTKGNWQFTEYRQPFVFDPCLLPASLLLEGCFPILTVQKLLTWWQTAKRFLSLRGHKQMAHGWVANESQFTSARSPTTVCSFVLISRPLLPTRAIESKLLSDRVFICYFIFFSKLHVLVWTFLYISHGFP